MSMMTRLRGVFGRGQTTNGTMNGTTNGHNSGHSNGHVNGHPTPESAHIDSLDLDNELYTEIKPDSELSPRKSKSEMLAELHRNYEEVLGIVRKVDDHLDEQRHRGERLMEIAERIPPALETLPAIQEQTVRLTEAIDRLADNTARHAARSDSAAQAQTQALAHVKSLLEQSHAAERRVAESVDSFKTTVDGMSEATATVGRVLQHMQERDAAREKQLTDVINRGSRTMTLTVGLCGLLFLSSTVVALMALAN